MVYTVSTLQVGGEDEDKLQGWALKGDDMEVDVLAFGATLHGLRVKAGDGQLRSVLISPSSTSSLVDPARNPYMGSTVGRYANRICKGEFELEGVTYALDINNGDNHLHGGKRGYSWQVWKESEKYESADECFVTIMLEDGSDELESGASKGGKQSYYPGKVTLFTTFRVKGKSLSISHSASSTVSTPISITTHPYFNLDGIEKSGESASVLDHTLTLDVDAYLPVDSGSIPTRVVEPLPSSPFSALLKAGSRIRQVLDEMQKSSMAEGEEEEERAKNEGRTFPFGFGIDHCFLFSQDKKGEEYGERRMATLASSDGHLTMEVSSTLPAIQVYTANYLSRKDGHPTSHHSSVCLETQYYPDGPNLEGQIGFPHNCIFGPNRKYEHCTTFIFT